MNELKNLFNSRKANTTGFSRHSSVIIPIIAIDGKLHVIFEKRALHLKTQPGEICFPGGTVEPNESFEAAVIRETSEELNLDPNQIEIIGQMDSVATNFDMLIHCFVGIIHEEMDAIRPSSDEVAYLFTVSLDEILDTEPTKHILHGSFNPSKDFPFEKIPQGKHYNFKSRDYEVLFYPYKHDIIWGLTAKMLHNFSKFLNDNRL